MPPPGVGVAYSVLPRILRMSSGLQDWWGGGGGGERMCKFVELKN